MPCKTCIHADVKTDADFGLDRITCHRNAPIAGIDECGVFPIMQPEDWCAQFRGRTKASETPVGNSHASER